MVSSKQKAKKKIKVAFDLIQLYAKVQKGLNFNRMYLQNELEASFIYQDTPDQLSTAAVKSDMEQLLQWMISLW